MVPQDCRPRSQPSLGIRIDFSARLYKSQSHCALRRASLQASVKIGNHRLAKSAKRRRNKGLLSSFFLARLFSQHRCYWLKTNRLNLAISAANILFELATTNRYYLRYQSPPVHITNRTVVLRNDPQSYRAASPRKCLIMVDRPAPNIHFVG